MITPLDIENKKFSKQMMNGYSVDEVDDFLDDLTLDYTKNYKENTELKAKVEELTKSLEQYRNIEQTLQSTLLMAQTTAEDVKKVAKQQADQIINDAKDTAKQQAIELDNEIIVKRKELDDVKKQLTQSSKKYSSFIEETIIYIKEHIADDLSLELIAQNVHTNESYLSRTFKKECGHSIVSYITMLRISMAKDFLANTNLKTFEISDKIGIHDPAYFSVIFKKNTGLSPKDYRNQFVR